MPSSSDRRLVHALGAESEPGMRKLIVGMLTKDAWQDAERDGDTGELHEPGEPGEPDELSTPSIKAVLRWTFDIDLRD